ncbi:DUF1540 domain-containing protein [Clostridium ihumii]|uniref:DUF1540 domain-containing protein n=1 Tax=Clostridium ihumii TaxID=1470356 RepID=UPI00058BAA98|nr:DUF1540 domain-containing protein [Clostridium ihumii]
MSGTLSCTARNCLYNGNGLCTANTIKISGRDAESSIYTQCDTFAEQGLRNSLSNIFNVNIGGEIMQAFSNTSIEMSPHIQCDAQKCMYNMGNTCTADYIYINGHAALSNIRTECETFRK